MVELNGINAGSSSEGLTINTTNCTIRGFAINRFALDGIRIQGSGNVVAGNFLGTDVNGTTALGNAQGGVAITGSGNTVGGLNPGDGNLISGGNLAGIYLENGNPGGNVVEGNDIGTDITGLLRLGNTNGIVISSGVSNVIGGTVAAARNIISGNYQSGIYMINGATGANGNVIQGNYVGPNVNGTAALANLQDGITVVNSANNLFGGAISGAGNVISGNTEYGIFLTGTTTTNNSIQGCLIGTTSSGMGSLPNTWHGVAILNASANMIGGTNSGAGNVVSANQLNGVDIEGSTPAQASGNVVEGNFIGTDITGTNAMGNSINGVFISAVNNSIGAALPGAGNIISGNGLNGIYISSSASVGNLVAGNQIGTDVTGLKALGNAQAGVRIEASSCTVGGTNVLARNLVSGNNLPAQIYIYGSAVSNNVVQGCYIGVDATGTTNLYNQSVGIYLTNAFNNLVGGSVTGAGNLIAGNAFSGIYAGSSSGNSIQGNFIGTDLTGMHMLANGWAWTNTVLYPPVDGAGGIDVSQSSSNLIGGVVAGAGNLISGNYRDGVAFGDPICLGNVVQGNKIGTAIDGVSFIGNEHQGVEMRTAGFVGSTIIGGTTPAAYNTIWYSYFGQVSNNGYSGVRIRTANGNTNNQVLGNSIYKNGNLGIDSGTIGVSTNRVSEAADQNYPVLTNALSANNVTVIQGTLHTVANNGYLIQFYASATPNGWIAFGQGQTYLGSTNVMTDVNGNASFNAVLPVGVAPGQIISSTAFGMNGLKNNSEFSQDYTNAAALQPGITSLQPASTNVPYGSSATFTVTATGTGTLSYQWSLNNTNISGATSPTLMIPNVQPSNAGNYTVQVSSLFGSTNATAVLSVQVNPVPLQVSLANGQFSVSWPTNGPAFTLQQSPTLSPPNWADSTNPPVIAGSQMVVTMPVSGASQFYRLILTP